MKLFTTAQLRDADQYTLKKEPIASLDLMERAAARITARIRQIFPGDHRYIICCGPGNNGGDGLVIARLLHQQGVKVSVYLLDTGATFSEDCGINLNRLRNTGLEEIRLIRSANDFPVIPPEVIVVDALFGSGLSRPLQGEVKELVRHINASGAFVVAVDMPSGLMGEDNSANDRDAIIRANHTLTIHLPKLAFFFADNAPYTGTWETVDIVIHPGYAEQQDTPYQLLTGDMIRPLLQHRPRFGHKGSFGHALVAAGSYGKMGAAILASRAALRSGAGLLTVRIPACGYTALQSAFPEAMADADEEERFLATRISRLERYDAVGIGPGIGTDPATANVLKLLIQDIQTPLVLDADAINLLAENKTWLSFLPSGAILTPHPGEFDRLGGSHTDGYNRLQTQRELSRKYGIFIVLKGAYTTISTPEGRVYFNATGNPGMATAGSGDVLTGVITGLLAQAYPPYAAALAGVYLHGLSGDLAMGHLGGHALIASDIVQYLGTAFLQLAGN